MGLEVLFLCARRSHGSVLLCRRGVRCLLEEEAARRAPVTVTGQRHCGGPTSTTAFPAARTDNFHGLDPWRSSLRRAAGHRWSLHHRQLYWEGGGGLGGGHHGGQRRSQVSTTRGLCSHAPGGKQPHEPREDSTTTTTTTTTTPTTTDAGQGLFKFKELYENPWTIPNLLCVCRIVLAPYLGYLIIEQHFNLSLVLFTLAGATDLLDGYIARTWPSQKSAMGSALDPLADKILISFLYVSLTYAQLIPAPLTALVIFRDVGLIAAVFWVRYKTVPPPVTLSKFFNPCYATAQLKPTLFSKVNTAIQLLLVAASLASPVFHFTDSMLLQSLWYITAVTTAASGYSYWHYGRKTVEVLNAQKRPEQ